MRTAALLLLLLCPSALAQDSESESDARARVFYDEGVRLYEAGMYEEALNAFKIAYENSKRPLLLYNMAQAMERIGQWDEALAALEDYRLDAPEEELAQLDSRIAALQSRISERDAAAKAQQDAAVAERARKGPPVGAWVLFGTGAVGVGLGSVFTSSALSARSEWTSACLEGNDGLICPADASDAWARDNKNSLIADIGWIVGVGGIGGGVALTVAGGKNSDLTLAAGPGHVRLGGRW